MKSQKNEENVFFTHPNVTNEKIEERTCDIICCKYNSTDKSYYNMLINSSTLEVDIHSIVPIKEIKEQLKDFGFSEKEYLYKISVMDVLSIHNTCILLNSLPNQSVIMAYPTYGVRAVVNQISKVDDARKDEYELLSKSFDKIKNISFVELNKSMEKAIDAYLWQNNLNYGNQEPEKNTKPRKLR